MITNEQLKNKLIDDNDTNDTNNESIKNEYLDIIEKLETVKGGCGTCGGGINMARQKNKDSLTTQVKDTLNLIIRNKNNAMPFGSYVYRSQYYPSDIDYHEVFETSPSKVESIYNITIRALKKFTRDVQKKRSIYFSEIKTGLDFRFDLDVLSDNFLDDVTDLYKKKLFTKDEYEYINILHDAYKKDVSCCALDELKEIIRLKRILRWKAKDILRGYVIVVGNKKITLDEAVRHNAQIKIDIWAPINGRYIEITNFFFLVVYDKETKKIIILNHTIGNYVKMILEQVIKYSSKLFFNPFKMAKRMWGIARETKNDELLKTLMPLFQGPIAKINQIIAEIEVLVGMCENLKSLPLQTMIAQIDEFKQRLSNIYNIEYDENQIYMLIDEILKKKKNKKVILDNLIEIKTLLKNTRTKYTLIFLKAKNLYPVPSYIFDITSPDRPLNDFVLFKHVLK